MNEDAAPVPPAESAPIMTKPATSQAQTGKFWRFSQLILLTALVINTALIAIVLLVAAFAVTHLHGSTSSLQIGQQAGCLRYYEFVVDEARAGLSESDIQRLVDRAARGSGPDGRLDTVSNGCGVVREVLTGIKLPTAKAGG